MFTKKLLKTITLQQHNNTAARLIGFCFINYMRIATQKYDNLYGQLSNYV